MFEAREKDVVEGRISTSRDTPIMEDALADASAGAGSVLADRDAIVQRYRADVLGRQASAPALSTVKGDWEYRSRSKHSRHFSFIRYCWHVLKLEDEQIQTEMARHADGMAMAGTPQGSGREHWHATPPSSVLAGTASPRNFLAKLKAAASSF